ncbi:MAG: Flp pilus assembly protein CpaB [Pseudomonadota bacterium]
MQIQRFRQLASTTTFWLVLTSVIAGTTAFWLAQRHLQRQESRSLQALQARFTLRQIIVAARDLPTGRRLGTADLATRDVPARFSHSASLRPDDAPLLIGRALRYPIGAGDAVLERDLEHRGGGSLATDLEAGTRAVTLAVDDVNAVAGHLRPGDHIDLFHVQPSRTAGAELLLLLQSVRVLAAGPSRIGAELEPQSGEGFATLVLQLAPDDAARLLIALRTGQVFTALRHPQDRGTALLKVRSGRDLAGPLPLREPRRSAAVQVISGGNRQPTAGITELASGRNQ